MGTEAAILVVGAGPTGLLLASELERRGVPCHLIDARPGPQHWDRATVVHPRSMQIFESMGLAAKFLEAGCRQRIIKIHSNGEVLGTLDLSTCGSIYAFNVGLSEEVTESILTEYLRQQGGEVNRSSRLVGLAPQGDGVVADIEGDGERYQVNAQWVAGCDGLHSAVRELSGIRFEGDALAKEWAVFDTTVQGWAESFEGTFVYLDDPGVVLTALPGHRWRVYLRPRSEESDLIADAASTLSAYIPSASFVDVENPARFHCHTKIASKYRSGAAFLAGDAAHVCSPSQGHGMNCGLQDAFNLAWKLALVHHGAAQPSLLDSYEKERRAAAELVTQSGDETERAFMTTDPVERESRNQAIRAMIADPKTRHHEVVAEAELNIDYARSPIVLGGADGHLSPGYRLPDTITVRHPGAQTTRLHEVAQRAGHTLLLLGGAAADVAAFVELHAALQELGADSHLCLKQHSRLAAILICLRISGGSIRLKLISSE
jgi:2-polyprenyl-6-methoxyphenol hydroxylase-like FAD-dependent oxidoreductase